MTKWYFGTIGYSYKEWIGGLYPKGINPREYLSFYAKAFKSVEIDTSFHAPPRIETVQSWKASVPPGFKFSFKTPQKITHDMGLYHAEGLMLEFLETLTPLEESLGPILIQLPPSFRFDRINLLHQFLEALPSTLRYAVELRHSSWYNDETGKMLSECHVCWASIDFPNIPRMIIPTTDFIYLRWIGINGMYHGHSYERVEKAEQLSWWLEAIREKSSEIPEVFGYFNNDYTGFAAGTCKRFMMMAGLLNIDNELPYQERLF